MEPVVYPLLLSSSTYLILFWAQISLLVTSILQEVHMVESNLNLTSLHGISSDQAFTPQEAWNLN